MILLALGANMAFNNTRPEQTLHATIAAMKGPEVHILSISPFYETPAWPDPNDPPFVNAVCRVACSLNPKQLLSRLHGIEDRFGRMRLARNSPRTIDIDIIDFDGRVEAGPPTLPHPRLVSRGFVLIPLRDVAPDWRHPATGQSVDELVAALPPEARIARRLD
ncbi:MAG TPA: 2-amino-4-hydroxy-6-hydroxymethyldihydropteridine diphosphokinase [Rhizomicrobium sp.]|nr:2-amino-4-hydroxy-6-hydroxymethyldihydropteridine diphosphokinase [Rhizomicrobium sp.]